MVSHYTRSERALPSLRTAKQINLPSQQKAKLIEQFRFIDVVLFSKPLHWIYD